MVKELVPCAPLPNAGSGVEILYSVVCFPREKYLVPCLGSLLLLNCSFEAPRMKEVGRCIVVVSWHIMKCAIY